MRRKKHMTRKFYRAFGQRLKSAREQDGVSQLDMAIFLRSSVKSVRRYEAGFKPLTISNYFKVCKYLEVNPWKMIATSLGDWLMKKQ